MLYRLLLKLESHKPDGTDRLETGVPKAGADHGGYAANFRPAHCGASLWAINGGKASYDQCAARLSRSTRVKLTTLWTTGTGSLAS